MSDKGLLNRMERLEVRLDVGNKLSRLTSDELQIRILDVCRAMIERGGETPEVMGGLSSRVDEIERGIRAQAAMRRQPDDAKHLAWVQGKRATYVPAVCGHSGEANSMNEYDDLHRPSIMERRLAILARPDLQALVDERVT
jgi:hypothetical protein